MAYEVARVHGLILSNIQDGVKDVSETSPLSKSSYQMPPRSSPDTPFLYDFPSELNQWSESSHSFSLESSTETETESDDEDDFIAGLAEQIAHSMLEEDEPANVSGILDGNAPNASTDASVASGATVLSPRKVVVSPQSSWSPSSLAASWSDSVSSSKQSSEVSSPPSTPSSSETDAWDLLNAAAGAVVRMKMNDDRRPLIPVPEQVQSVTGSLPETATHSLIPQQPTTWRPLPHLVQISIPTTGNGGPRSSPPVLSSKDRLQVSSSQHTHKSWNRPKDEDRKVYINGSIQQRLPRNDAGGGWNQRQNRPSNLHKGPMNQKSGRQNYNHGGQPRMSGKSIECSGAPQRSGAQGLNGGSGMRAVFLGSAGSGRESGGTGVFLPRCIGGGSDHRRKPACSTVLLPSRIVQVLNLNVEDMRTHPTSLPTVAVHGRNEYAGALRTPSHMYMMELSTGTMKYEGQNASSFPRKIQNPQLGHSEPIEFSLPTEWTY